MDDAYLTRAKLRAEASTVINVHLPFYELRNNYYLVVHKYLNNFNVFVNSQLNTTYIFPNHRKRMKCAYIHLGTVKLNYILLVLNSYCLYLI